MSSGKLFQTAGAACEKEQSAKASSLYGAHYSCLLYCITTYIIQQ